MGLAKYISVRTMPVMTNPSGRPKKARNKVLGDRLELRLNAAERKAYEQAAKKAGLSVSEWIRECLANAVGSL
jgi:predicted HicB family RNase H-like nuclease